MRGETVFALKQAGVEMADLVFGDDACVSMLFDKAVAVGLCDHCKADDFSQQGAPKIDCIVDHHKDQDAHPQVQGYLRKIAQGHIPQKDTQKQLIGSCTSAVVENYLGHHAHSGVELLSRDNGAVAIVLYSVILIDTMVSTVHNIRTVVKTVCRVVSCHGSTNTWYILFFTILDY